MLVTTDMIKRLYEHNGFISIMGIGYMGVGKTSYALHVAKEVYGGWEHALDYLFFDVDPALDLIYKLAFDEDGKRIPLIIFDDAGLWLSRLEWWREDIKRFIELYNVIRSLFSAVIYTTPSKDLPGPILSKIQLRVTFKSISNGEAKQRLGLDDMHWRDLKGLLKLRGQNPDLWNLARGYTLHQLPSFMSFVKKRFEDVYPLHYPKDIYMKYEEKRREAVKRAVIRLMSARKKKEPVEKIAAKLGVSKETVEEIASDYS